MNTESIQSPVPPVPPPVRKQRTKTKVVRKKQPTRRPHKVAHKKPVSHHGSPRRPVRKELSAGGVAARQERGQWVVALLKTEHKKGEVWVLPKGHVELEKNEKISEAARREVQEEAGIKDLSVKDQLGITRFTFQAEDAVVRKTVHYFLMTTGQKLLTPQIEEGLIEAAWFPIDLAIQMLEYDTDQDIVAKAREKLTGQKAAIPARVRSRRRIQVHL